MSARWKPTPVLKILEALGAVADARVVDHGDGTATVRSSDGAKRYTVTWDRNTHVVASNDNASYWQGYLGYPGIALLMTNGVLPFDHELARSLAGIPWKTLNRKLRDHDKVIGHLRDELGIDVERADAFAATVKAAMHELGLVKPDKRPAPARRAG